MWNRLLIQFDRQCVRKMCGIVFFCLFVGFFLAVNNNRTAVYPYHYVAPSRAMIVTLTYVHSCLISYLF